MSCSVNYQYTYSNITHTLAYDLCPLFLQHQVIKHEITEDTPPTQTKYVYEIALGNGIKRDGTLPTDLQCPSNSFTCLTVVNTRPGHPSEPARILQVIPIAAGDIRPKFRHTNTTTGSDLVESHLQVTVHGLQYMNRNHKAVFHMYCDESPRDDAPSANLEFLYSWNGTYAFGWKTPYGCPTISLHHGDSQQRPDDGDDPERALPPVDPDHNTADIKAPRSSLPLWFLALTIMGCILTIRQAKSSEKYRRHLRRFRAYIPAWLRPIAGSQREILAEVVSGANELQPLNKHARMTSRYQRYI